MVRNFAVADPASRLLPTMSRIESFCIKTSVVFSVAGLLVIAAALVSTARASALGGNASLTTDYVWRGSTQTQGNPAVQAGLRLASESGAYASIWGSSVEFAPGAHASSELDFILGWDHDLGDDWALDINVLHYRYPSTTVDLNWTEFNGTATYQDDYWASVGYSHEALGYDASGVYMQLGARFPITDRVRVEAVAGHYFLDDSVVASSRYTHGQVSAVWAFQAPFELRLSAHATDSNAKAIFGDKFAGSRIEAALQTTF